MATAEPREQHPEPGDICAEDTDFGQAILDRPEVHDVTMHYGDGRLIVFVYFETWEIPPRFGADYDMQLVSAFCWDERPWYKRVIGVGRPARLVGHFIRDRRSAAAFGSEEVADGDE